MNAANLDRLVSEFWRLEGLVSPSTGELIRREAIARAIWRATRQEWCPSGLVREREFFGLMGGYPPEEGPCPW